MTRSEDAFFSHETAIVEQGASVGDGSNLWHHSHVRAGARIGAGCTLGKNVFVDADVSIGDRSKVQNNVSVYTGVTLGDEVFVGPSAVFTNDLYPRATSPEWTVVRTNVGRGASIGANATIVCGNDIGEFATVGSGAVVTSAVEDHALVVGNPAKLIGWMCECGRVARHGAQRPATFECDDCADPNGDSAESEVSG